MSWHSGPCFGAGRLPFELSKEGTERFLEKIVLPARKKARESLVELKERPDQITVSSSFRGDRIISRGQASYEMELESAIRQVERQMETIDKEVVILRWLVDHWRKRELPGPNERPINWYMDAERDLRLQT